MKYMLLPSIILLLAGCGGDSDDSQVAPNKSSVDGLRETASIVADESGNTYAQMDVLQSEEIVITLPSDEQKSAVFTLASNSDDESAPAEKLVVSGKLTIK
ncbi:hypothetical protein [Vibrio variabilis]|uniref:hypothetical protein n=1 Tax=Vibrio variabilis TaxID=990271 RepID=UPI0013A6AB10|nr:hypothetical protein [Vibrio variabilis]